MSLTVTLLGTGSPMPSPDRAGPATLISAGEGVGGEHYLVDAGRGVLMRLAALGLGAPTLAAVLITAIQRMNDTLDYHSSPAEAGPRSSNADKPPIISEPPG